MASRAPLNSSACCQSASKLSAGQTEASCSVSTCESGAQVLGSLRRPFVDDRPECRRGRSWSRRLRFMLQEPGK